MEEDIRQDLINLKRAEGMPDGVLMDAEVETEVRMKMEQMKNLFESNQYQKILSDFSDLINKPTKPVPLNNQKFLRNFDDSNGGTQEGYLQYVNQSHPGLFAQANLDLFE